MTTGNHAGRIAALDLGEAYTGVALSDPGATLARPLEVVPSDRLADYLSALIPREGVFEVVVGVPKTLGGEVGFQAQRALSTLDELEGAFPETRFVPWDERLTTRIARSTSSAKRSAPGRKRRVGKERVDHLAAAAMLQEYLDRGKALGPAR